MYYCAGITRATEESSSLLLVKYKADGTRLWSRTWLSPAANGAAAAQVAVADDGDVIVAGTVGVAPPASWKGRDVVVLRFAPDGTREWVRRFDGPGHKDDYVADLALDGAGAAFVSGGTRGATTGQDYLALAVTTAGAVQLVLDLRRPRRARLRHRGRRRRRRQLLRHRLQPGQERYGGGGDRQAQPSRRHHVAQAPAVRR